MLNNSEIESLELVCVIVNCGMGSKVMHKAKRCGIRGGTVFLGRGTADDAISNFLELNDIRKEIVLLVSNKKTVECALEALEREFEFEKPNHGIIFTTAVSSIIGARGYESEETKEERGVVNKMYESITVIVDKGKAEQVIEAALKAGSAGGTIINARGSGIHETSKIFAMEIEPEKEIVLILSKKEKTEKIVFSIREQLKMDEPGNGIIFIQDVNRVYGLYE